MTSPPFNDVRPDSAARHSANLMTDGLGHKKGDDAAGRCDVFPALGDGTVAVEFAPPIGEIYLYKDSTVPQTLLRQPF